MESNNFFGIIPPFNQNRNPLWRQEEEKEDNIEGENPHSSSSSSSSSTSSSYYYPSSSSSSFSSSSSSSSSSTPSSFSSTIFRSFPLNSPTVPHSSGLSSSLTSSPAKTPLSTLTLSSISQINAYSTSIFSFLNASEVAKLESLSQKINSSITHYWTIRKLDANCIEWRIPPELSQLKKLKKLSFSLPLILSSLPTISDVETFWKRHQLVIEHYPSVKYLFREHVKEFHKVSYNKELASIGCLMTEEEAEKEKRLIVESKTPSDYLLFSLVEAAKGKPSPETSAIVSDLIDQAIENGIPSAAYLLWKFNKYFFDLETFGLKAIAAMKKGHLQLALTVLKDKNNPTSKESLFNTMFVTKEKNIREDIPLEILEYLTFSIYWCTKDVKLSEQFFNELMKRWKYNFQFTDFNLFELIDLYVDFKRPGETIDVKKEMISVCNDLLNAKNLNNGDKLTLIIILHILRQEEDALRHFNKIPKEFIIHKISEFEKNKYVKALNITMSFVKGVFSLSEFPTSLLIERANSLANDLYKNYEFDPLPIFIAGKKSDLFPENSIFDSIGSRKKEADQIYSTLLTRQEKLPKEVFLRASLEKFYLKQDKEVIRLFKLYHAENLKENSNHINHEHVIGTLMFIRSNLKLGDKETANTFMGELLKNWNFLPQENLDSSILMAIKILKDFNQVEKADKLLGKLTFDEIVESLKNLWLNSDFEMIDFIYENILPKLSKTNADLSTLCLYLFGKSKYILNVNEFSKLEGITLIELALKKLADDRSLIENSTWPPNYPMEALINAYRYSFNNRDNRTIFLINKQANFYQLDYPPDFLINEVFPTNFRNTPQFADMQFKKGMEKAMKTGQFQNINQKIVLYWVKWKVQNNQLDEANKILNEFIEGMGVKSVIPELLEYNANIKFDLANQQDKRDQEDQEEQKF